MKMEKIKATHRPNSKTALVKFRVTEEQHAALMKIAHKRNTSFSVYARKVLLDKIIDTP